MLYDICLDSIKKGCLSSSRVKLDEAFKHKLLFASLLRNLLTFKPFLSFLSLFRTVLLLLMDKPNSRCNDPGKVHPMKRAAVSTDRERL